jgi:hypothetical protein
MARSFKEERRAMKTIASWWAASSFSSMQRDSPDIKKLG